MQYTDTLYNFTHHIVYITSCVCIAILSSCLPNTSILYYIILSNQLITHNMWYNVIYSKHQYTAFPISCSTYSLLTFLFIHTNQSKWVTFMVLFQTCDEEKRFVTTEQDKRVFCSDCIHRNMLLFFISCFRGYKTTILCFQI